jgi:hypothetical protein
MITTAKRTFAHRVGYLVTCVLPANLLSAEAVDVDDPSNLRADASQDGLSFIQVNYRLEDDLYVARVAASPDCAARGYTMLLSEDQLSFALPWETRLEWEDRLHTQKRCPESILTLLHLHAAEVRPLAKEPAGASCPVPTLAAALTPLDTVDVSADAVRDAFTLAVQDQHSAAVPGRRATQFYLQQALIQAMIDCLMSQLYQTQERTHALILKARCTLLAQVQRWHRSMQGGRIVNAVPHFSTERGQVLWRLTLGLPAVA